MFYLIDKPKGITSRDALDLIVKKLGVSKGGHSGTLDPFATGLLIIATENDTKHLNRFLESKKTYTGKILFGKTTDTLDEEGIVTETSDSKVNFNDLLKVVNENFVGKIKQLPPNYSAKKINGQKAYELSRKNIAFELKPSVKIIYDFKVLKTEIENEFDFEVTASSGTYIRALARDIGIALQVPAMLIELRRTAIGDISIKNAQQTSISKEDLKPYSSSEILNIKQIVVEDNYIKMLLEGKRVSFDKHIDLEDREILFLNEAKDNEILATRIDKQVYKISKRIR